MRLRRCFATVLTCMLLIGVSGLLSGCAEASERSTPEEALRSLQVALRDDLPLRAFELQDAETRAYFRQRVRTARARVAEGATAETVAPDDDVALELYHQGTLEEAAARAALELGQLHSMRSWLAEGVVIGHAVVDGAAADATLRVRGADGMEHDVHLVREADGWKLDAFRHFQELIARR
jgi:hypothetical protein